MVSIQQAGANRFARWLEQQLTGIKVVSRWPVGGYELPAQSISVVCAGPRQDQSIEHRYLSLTAADPVVGDTIATPMDALIQVAACTQPLQLDVWTKGSYERDAIVAQLDDLLRYGDSVVGDWTSEPTGNSVLLKLEDGWEATQTFVDFEFDSPDLDETASDLQRSLYRASYRGNARFMLTLPRRVALQTTLNFSLLLDGPDAARDLYTLPGA